MQINEQLKALETNCELPTNTVLYGGKLLLCKQNYDGIVNNYCSYSR